MALKDILSNAKYPDDMILNLPDGTTVNVGEIRALPAAERQALTKQIEERQNTLGQAELAFAAKFQEAVKAGWLTQDGKIVAPAAATKTPVPTAAEIRTAAAAEFNLDENDPLLGPIVKEFRTQLKQRDDAMAQLQSKIDALPSQFDSLKTTMTDALGKVTGVVNTSVGRYLNDTYQSKFAAATKDLPKGVTVDYEAAYKFATDHNLKDKEGFLLIDEAVDRLTYKDRQRVERESWQAEERKRLAKEAEENSRLASLQPPTSRNPLQSKPVKDGEFNPFKERTDAKGNKIRESKSFDEVIAEAANDEDVLKSALATASFGGVVQ